LRQGRRRSYSGEPRREHAEAGAERLLAQGLAVFRPEESRLAGQPKGGLEKQVLAWWLCRHTTACRRWVGDRFGTGDESRVTQAIRRVKREAQPGMQELKRRLEKACETNGAAEL